MDGVPTEASGSGAPIRAERNIFDQSGKSIITERNLLVSPLVLPIQEQQFAMVGPSEIIGIAQSPHPTGGSTELTVENLRAMMRDGRFDLTREDVLLSGFRLPKGEVFISTGLHRAEAAIKEGKSITVLIRNDDRSKYRVDDRNLETIRKRIAEGTLKGTVVEKDGRHILELSHPDDTDAAMLLDDPEKMQKIFGKK